MHRRMKVKGPRIIPLNAPSEVRVRADAKGQPAELRIGRKTLTVTEVQESWRIEDEWWRAPIRRDYHRLLLSDGRLLILYRDLETGGWYLQR